MMTGIFSTLLIPETKGRTLEDLSNEDQENFITGMVSPCPFRCGSLNLLSSIGVRGMRVDKEGVIVSDA
jgi:hypothetical protein